ncbi:D-alanyl-lipoteichoic acid acyltransferase DltB (MBOAT superfamily) [Spirosoma lacussanchae]|uniref:MBOAT family O-acyltransferase n=1 Tax=Spirosoma lacussanchae TaxID=1884249 RepID=UPI002938F8DA|nr:MBOAT family O-acyltransferase [Spirosoma lacussanchae]
MAFVPIYIVILGVTIVIDYFAGIYIEKESGHLRKVLLVCSLVANIGVLAIFKYYNFFVDNVNLLLNESGLGYALPIMTILLPIGLSFHTFQAMSYTIEVYRGNQKPEKHFGIYALYVMFYPQLVAGPIERPQNVLYQFYERHEYRYENISTGLKLIIWGLFKKVVIADRFAVIINTVYNDPTQFKGLPLIFATVLFAFQIYCDFSGYSDIALGTARTIGFRLMKNFDSPYFSSSISEFWKRWHISLSTWFRDYLYIPLGGNRVSRERWYFNLFVTFLVSGFWHGANWTYIIWGALNGVYLIIEAASKELREKIFSVLFTGKQSLLFSGLTIGTTFSLTCLAWVFFRAKTVKDAIYVIENMCVNIPSSVSMLKPGVLGSTMYDYIIGFGSLLILLVVEYIQQTQNRKWYFEQPYLIKIGLYYALVMIIILFGMFDVQEQFIYFQF